jgi:crotonobetainyl-CoA:carnitine CoA-transferase CaiB-like acyl-CoA transferase
MAERNPADEPAGALDGIRVVDLSRFIAGPYCAMLLGDMGADVVKVEPPGRGENSRAFAPFVAGESLYTMVFNRNKRSLTLDLRSDPGKDVLRSLLRKADVLVENFVPGTLEAMGFGWEALKALNPRLVVTRISGSKAVRPRSPLDVIARHERAWITGDPTAPHHGRASGGLFDRPVRDHRHLGALQARGRTGAGQIVDVALGFGHVDVDDRIPSSCWAAP